MRASLISLIAVSALLGGCGTFSGSEADAREAQDADFGSASFDDQNRLVVPPNVIAANDQVLLRVADGGLARLLPELRQARIKREGAIRWLEVDLEPEDVWTATQEFWQDEGFALSLELPEAGILETDWQQDRAQILGTGLTRVLDVALERLHDTGERYRFRTRLERGERPGTTYIFISYRAVAEVSNGEFAILEHDPNLEAEMLRRIMLSFRYPEESIATLDQFIGQEDADTVHERVGDDLVILRDREDAWRRLLLALDRAGYTVAEQNYESGSITLVVAPPTRDPESLSIFEAWFGVDDDELKPYEVTLQVSEQGSERTLVTLSAEAGTAEIIDLIAEKL